MIEELIKKWNNLRNELEEEIIKEFVPELTSIMQKYEKPFSIRWAQYTPYFNDGDECIFSLREIFWVEDDKEFESYDIKKDDNSLRKEVYEEIEDFIHYIPEEFLKNVFGDHVEITINSDGTKTIERYDHD